MRIAQDAESPPASEEERFSPERVFARIRAILSPPLDSSSHPEAAGSAPPDELALADAGGARIINGAALSVAAAAAAKPAAVLIGLVAHPNEVGVILTQRAAALSVHSGQIAFPGGKIDPQDESPLAAALREAQEEIGLDPSSVEPLGYLEPFFTGTGFRIIPVVAKVQSPVVLTVNPAEVDDAFEAPFAFLMDAANHAVDVKEFEGTLRHFYVMPYGGRRIWGVTAGILRNLYERLYS